MGKARERFDVGGQFHDEKAAGGRSLRGLACSGAGVRAPRAATTVKQSRPE